MILACSAFLAAAAAPCARAADGLALEGRVTTVEDRPAVGARLWLAVPRPDPRDAAELVATITCDGDGCFRIPVAGERFGWPGDHALDLYALGAESALFAVRYPGTELPVGESIEVRLPPRSDDAFPLAAADGAPVPRARVRLRALRTSAGARLVLPVALQERTEVGADDAGSVRPETWCVERAVAVAVVPEGGGAEQILEHVNAGAGWIEVRGARLEAVGPVEVTVTGDGPTIPLELRGRSARQIWRDPLAFGRVETGAPLPDGDGLAVLAGYGSAARVEARSDDPHVLRLAWSWDGVREGVGRTTFSWTSGTPVRGRVVDAGTGEPVAGVRLRATTGYATTSVVTDSAGEYRLRCAPGFLSLNHAVPPTGAHVPREFSEDHAHVPIAAGDAESVLPDWLLLPDDPVRGRVVDASGAPVAGAWVSASMRVPEGALWRTVTTHALSDAEGRFTLHGANVGVAEGPIEARLGRRRGSAERSAAGDGREVKIFLR